MLTNPRSERVRSVRSLSRRVVRERQGRFVAEGPQSVREAVAEHARLQAARGGSGPAPAGLLESLYVEGSAAERHADLVAAAQAAGVEPVEVTAEVLAAMADTVSPQGLLAVCRLLDVPLESALAARADGTPPRLVAVLAHVRDPGNAGTVLRAADAAGADAVVLTDESVDVHNPKVVRSTAGSLFHLPVTQGPGLAEVTSAARAAGLAVVAADGSGEDLDDLLDDAEQGRGPLAGPVAWVFGNEAWGLPEADRALADVVVRVPIHGRAESLNLASAASVCLYASARVQRRTRSGR